MSEPKPEFGTMGRVPVKAWSEFMLSKAEPAF